MDAFKITNGPKAQKSAGDRSQGGADLCFLDKELGFFLEALGGGVNPDSFELTPHAGNMDVPGVRCKPCGRTIGLSGSRCRSRFFDNLRLHLMSPVHAKRQKEWRGAAGGDGKGPGGGKRIGSGTGTERGRNSGMRPVAG